PANRCWERWCADGTLLAFVAVVGEAVVGLALAGSHPSAVHVFVLEGDRPSRHGLLRRLTRAAGERDVCVMFARGRTDLRETLDALGFRPGPDQKIEGVPVSVYRLDRN